MCSIFNIDCSSFKNGNAVVMILRPVLRALLREAPQMNFRLLPLSENVFRELAEGSVDLALFPTSLGETLPEHFHGLKLFDILTAPESYQASYHTA